MAYYYIHQAMLIVASALAIVLAVKAKKLIGRKWLIAAIIFTLIRFVGRNLFYFLSHRFFPPIAIWRWSSVLEISLLFATACFCVFLFSNWSQSRVKLDMKNLLFSFSGRIPRSVFWISVCVFFPLGLMPAAIPAFWSDHVSLVQIVLWGIYAVWVIPHTWIALAIYAKRWHDCSKSGWMTLVLFIPIVGFFWFWGYLGFVQGTQDPNLYGDSPLDIQSKRSGSS